MVASRVARAVAFSVVVCFISFPARAKYSGGTGEPNNPYQIATADDLMALGETPEDYDKHFILTVDIYLDPNLPGRKVFDKPVIAYFAGVFDGHGHTISRLTIIERSAPADTSSGSLGLFGVLDNGATVSSLGLEAVDVNGIGGSVGGLVGFNWGGNITSSYSAGSVTGGSRVGGLVGLNGGSITTSYSTGTVTGDEDVGGLVGDNPSLLTGSIASSFWDMEASGQSSSAGGTGLTTAEMQDINTYLNVGWDFVDEILNGTCDYWQMSPGDYPVLRYHNGESLVMPEGLGTTREPYLIRDAWDLGTVSIEPLAHYRLEASVDLSGITWSMAVVPWFEGTFDGNGYVISNLHIQGNEYLGLFGQLGYGAKISNLGLEAVEINGTGNDGGGLTGLNEGHIATSYSTGTFT